jgi:hypothetical protein
MYKFFFLRLKSALKVLKFLIFQRNLKFFFAGVFYLLGKNIGRDSNKVVLRYKDLSNIISLLPKNSKILEFGSGFSTILFNYSKNISKVTTIEEHIKYLPKVLKPFNYIISPTKRVNYKNFVTRKHHPLDIYNEIYQFIYIDGPSSAQYRHL